MTTDAPQPGPTPDNAEKSGGDDLAKGGKTPRPEKVRRALEKMGERVPETVMEVAMMSGVMGNPLHQKMTPAHIDKMLDLSVQHDANEHDLKKREQDLKERELDIAATRETAERRYGLVYFVCFIGLVVFIIAMFHTQPTVLVPILTGVGGAVTGFLGGIGYAKSKPPPAKEKQASS